jgi:hypothetical protein
MRLHAWEVGGPKVVERVWRAVLKYTVNECSGNVITDSIRQRSSRRQDEIFINIKKVVVLWT